VHVEQGMIALRKLSRLEWENAKSEVKLVDIGCADHVLVALLVRSNLPKRLLLSYQLYSL
jgi:hypothetical protein